METKEILNLAIQKKLCQPWQEKMKNDSSIENLCQMYFDGDDWAIKNDFPSISILREFKGRSEKFGIFTDYKGEIENLKQAAFFGKSEAKLTYNSFEVGNVIIRHESKLQVTASGNSILFITILDNATADIEGLDKSCVTIFNKSNNVIKSTGNVSVK